MDCGCSCPPGQPRCVPKNESTYSFTIDGRPSIYSSELPPWPTLEEIRKAIRDELKKAGVI